MVGSSTYEVGKILGLGVGLDLNIELKLDYAFAAMAASFPGALTTAPV